MALRINTNFRLIHIFYRCTVHFEIYAVHTPTNALFINLVKSFKFALKCTIISLLHVSVFNDHHQGALSDDGHQRPKHVGAILLCILM